MQSLRLRWISTILLACGVVPAHAAPAARSEPADLVFINGKVVIVGGADRIVGSVAVNGNRIAPLGDAAS